MTTSHDQLEFTRLLMKATRECVSETRARFDETMQPTGAMADELKEFAQKYQISLETAKQLLAESVEELLPDHATEILKMPLLIAQGITDVYCRTLRVLETRPELSQKERAIAALVCRHVSLDYMKEVFTVMNVSPETSQALCERMLDGKGA